MDNSNRYTGSRLMDFCSVASRFTSVFYSRCRIAAWGILLASLLFISSLCLAQQSRSTVERLSNRFIADATPALVQTNTQKLKLAWEVIVTPVAGSEPKSKLDTVLTGLLEARLAAILTERVPHRLHIPAGAQTEDLEEGARAVPADRLLVIRAHVDKAFLHLEGDLLDVRIDFWTRVRRPVTGVSHRFHVRVRLDAEIRSLLDLNARRSGARHFKESELDLTQWVNSPLSTAVGDVNGDGLQELIVLGENRLQVFQLLPDGEKRHLAQVKLSALAMRWRRSRDRYASMFTADLNGDGVAEILFWLSNRRYGHVYSMGKLGLHPFKWPHKRGHLCRKSQLPGSPVKTCGPPLAVMRSDTDNPYLLVGKILGGRNHLEPDVAAWNLNNQALPQPLKGLYWSISTHALKQADIGQVIDLISVVDKNSRASITSVDVDSQVLVRDTAESWHIDGVGTASALVDFDDDGIAEFVTSSDAWPGQSDWISIHQLQANGQSTRIWRSKSETVHHLSSGDFDNDGDRDIVAVVSGKVIAIREIESTE